MATETQALRKSGSKLKVSSIAAEQADKSAKKKTEFLRVANLLAQKGNNQMPQKKRRDDVDFFLQQVSF